jgi:hypothetical protein
MPLDSVVNPGANSETRYLSDTGSGEGANLAPSYPRRCGCRVQGGAFDSRESEFDSPLESAASAPIRPLALIQAPIDLAARQELLMPSLIHDAPAIDHQNPIGLAHG